ncbi:sugar ABC transporter ATP-binding protein [Actinomadura sp. 6N118]|uniref:sugar ABC transporter ATP-binding protein n=1 Tax=Actinomadura sp. 6N118 TaxID=3375151 RepID=UPI0037B561D8
MPGPALRVKGLSKSFPGQRALADVDLDIAPGEIRGLVGQNGSGKSTLIKVLAGYHAPDPGATVEVAGTALPLGAPGAGDAAGLRFVHQDLGLVPTLDTVDNLALGRGYETGPTGLVRWRRERAAARSALERLGYHFSVRRPLGELSVSERTAVAVARALSRHATPPRVLVLDEPTANLPDTEVERLFSLVRSVRDSGVAVLFVSHHLDEVFGLCDTVSVLRDGRHVATVPVSGLEENALVELMIGRRLEQYDAPAAVPGTAGEVVVTVSELTGAVLAGVSFEMRAGEVVGIAGITGSGREEITSAIFGGVPRGGTVTVAGTALPPSRPDLSMAAGIGLVPAERHANAAFLEHSLRENVSIADHGPFRRHGLLSRGRERSDVAAWLERLDVRPPGTERRLAALSGGNQQKVVLARWLRRTPRVLLLDEPTQGVDVGAKEEIHALVDRAAAGGAAVVVASSDDTELARLCGRVIVLLGGRAAEELHRPDLDAGRITALTVRKASA